MRTSRNTAGIGRHPWALTAMMGLALSAGLAGCTPELSEEDVCVISPEEVSVIMGVPVLAVTFGEDKNMGEDLWGASYHFCNFEIPKQVSEGGWESPDNVHVGWIDSKVAGSEGRGKWFDDTGWDEIARPEWGDLGFIADMGGGYWASFETRDRLWNIQISIEATLTDEGVVFYTEEDEAHVLSQVESIVGAIRDSDT